MLPVRKSLGSPFFVNHIYLKEIFLSIICIAAGLSLEVFCSSSSKDVICEAWSPVSTKVSNFSFESLGLLEHVGRHGKMAHFVDLQFRFEDEDMSYSTPSLKLNWGFTRRAILPSLPTWSSRSKRSCQFISFTESCWLLEKVVTEHIFEDGDEESVLAEHWFENITEPLIHISVLYCHAVRLCRSLIQEFYQD